MSPSPPRALVVAPDRDDARALVVFLRASGFHVEWARDDESAANVLAGDRVDVLVGELDAPHIDGLSLLTDARFRDRDVCAVLVADATDSPAALEAMRRGAYDVQARPLQHEKLLATLELGLRHRQLARRVEAMEGELDRRYSLRALAGRSRAIQRVRDQVRPLAAARTPVLLTGERGSGKGVIARALHRAGPRRERRFEIVRADGPVHELVEMEWFGFDGGAASRPGRVELADGGTLFVEAIEHASPPLQARLLRLLRDRRFERVQGTVERRADVRVIAATDGAALPDGALRADLLEVLAQARIDVPPLRERLEDLPELIEAFVRDANREHGRRVPGLTAGAFERLRRYAWPGNVGELKSVIDGMVAAASGRAPLTAAALPEALRDVAAGERLEFAVGTSLAEAERQLIDATLRHVGGDRKRAAKVLGIGLRTLYRKLSEKRPD